MTDLTALVAIALTLAVALFGMVTRLIIPVVCGQWKRARGLWARQVAAAEAQIRALQAARLPRSHRRPKFHRRTA